MITLVYTLLFNNSNLSVCFLENTKEIFTEKIENQIIEYDENFKEEIKSFNSELKYIKNISTFPFWPFISPCISGYLIKKSYFKINNDRIQSYEDFMMNRFSFKNLDKGDFIELRSLGFGSLFKVQLIYHIDRGELFALKKPNLLDNEIPKLIEREKSNYEKIQIPFIPKFYGTVKNENSLIIEFINGQTLDKCQFDEYDINDIIIIIYKLLFIVEFIHYKNLLIRDLKPKNLMITGENDIVMIDFDRIINKSTQEHSCEIYNEFSAPEVNTDELYSDKSDIYSLGKVIEFILAKTNVKNEISSIDDIIKQCLQENANQRPSTKIIIDNYSNIFQNSLSKRLNKTKIISSILPVLSILNTPRAQFNLGVIYYTGKYVERDINKAIHYYSLASDQNIPQAQFNLGVIYFRGKYVEQDINKAIHYYSLASNQNHPQVQFYLGLIYETGEYVERDINKAIYYYSLASKKNFSQAQYNLGLIYETGEYVERDINKAIHYYTLASNQNHPQAHNNLGYIYETEEYAKRDINKAIYYYSLASDQNIPQAQYNLGVIYSTGKYVERDINKAIYYYSLASNQNIPQAQFNLGIIYYSGFYCEKDINKGQQFLILSSYYEYRPANFAHGFLLHKEKKITEAIHYYKEASSFNIQYAKNNLGIIYKHGFSDEIPKRIGDSIVYFEEAIRQKNDILSMYNLAHIHFYEETIKRDIDKSIKLLIKSSREFEHSFNLLCVILIKTFGFNNEIIRREIDKRVEITNELYVKISYMINFLIKSESYVDYLYETYRNKDFLYDVLFQHICSSDLMKENTDQKEKNQNLKDISEEFYEGFGYDLINRNSKT